MRPAATVDGIRVATTWEDVIGYTGEITLTKDVTPTTDITYHGTVTYTVVLANSMAISETVLFTDTLPTEVDFGAWIAQPAGALVANDEITWSGALTASTTLTFTFTAVHVGDYSDVVTNTAEFSGTTQAGSAEATFTVESLFNDVTFIYHDLEGVVATGETVLLAGDFNGWTPTLMSAAGDTFTLTLANLIVGDTYAYKYIVNDGVTDQWDWLQGPGAAYNRVITITNATAQNDYRNVAVGWANLQWPFTLQTNAGEATDSVYGRVYIENVTNPAGEGRGIAAQVGYGDMVADPAAWTWFPMTYNTDDGNNDEFMGVMTPTLGGVFSYTTRFDGNWGVGNPNAAWTYAAQTGVLTSTTYDIAVTKSALVNEVIVRNGVGALVTYTLEIANLSNISTTTAITLADILPPGFAYVSNNSGMAPSGDGSPGNPLIWVFATPLVAGDSLSFTLVLSATDAITQSHVANNTARIAVNPPDWNSANNSSAAPVRVTRVISIAAARLLPNGAQATIEGVVTAEPGIFQDSNQNRKLYMQDNTGGMLIYLASGLNPVARGNRVRVTGALDEYRTERELIPLDAAAVVDLGAGAPVIPQPLPADEVTEDVEGQLIQVAGYITEKPFAYVLRINDGTGQIDINRYINLGLPTDPNYIDFTPFVVGDYVVVTGVTRGYDYTGIVRREVLPRGPADITELYPTTFVYHDLEDVVQAGEQVWIAGSFTNWGTNPIQLNANAAASVFSATVTIRTAGAHEYKYIVDTGEQNWNWLQSNNRSVVVTTSATINDYRNIAPGWMVLQWPHATTVNLGETTETIYAQVWADDLTSRPGAPRALLAQLGYGTAVNPAAWPAWTAMTWSSQEGNNDQFAAALTPTAGGVYSYAVRFDGNWGVGNPNMGWLYADKNGAPYTPDQAGILTVTAPDLTIAKAVDPDTDVDLGDIVTYTLALSNDGDGAAVGIALTDTLPAGVTFGGFVSANGATETGGVITWSGALAAGASVEIIFTATVDMNYALYGQTITNSAAFTSANAGTGSDDAAFTVAAAPTLEIAKFVTPIANVDLGDVVTYTLSLNNDSDANAYGILLTDTLPSGVTFGGWAMGTNVAADYTAGVITWSGDLPSGVQNIAIVFTATVGSDPALYGRSIVNTVAFTSANAGAGADDATFGMIGAPVLALTKTVATGAEVDLGDVVTYTLSLVNSGAAAATGVALTDALPAGVTFGAFVAANGATQTGGVVSWNGSLAAGASVHIIFTATVNNNNALYGQTITNVASFTSTNDGNGSDSAAFTVKNKPFHMVYLPLVLRALTP